MLKWLETPIDSFFILPRAVAFGVRMDQIGLMSLTSMARSTVATRAHVKYVCRMSAVSSIELLFLVILISRFVSLKL